MEQSIILYACVYLCAGALFCGIMSGLTKKHSTPSGGELVVFLLLWPLLSIFILGLEIGRRK